MRPYCRVQGGEELVLRKHLTLRQQVHDGRLAHIGVAYQGHTYQAAAVLAHGGFLAVYIGQLLDSVDLAKVERILDNKSAILKTEAYTTPDGMLNVKVFQREPVIRFQKGGNGFYADEKGFLFPLQSNYTSQVPIIDGNVPLTFESGYKGEPVSQKEKDWLGNIIALVNFMQESKNWSENISQISVRPDGDLVMVPRQGKELFIFGGPDNYEDKFSRMEKYYTTILPEKGEGYYSTVNLKYNGQIVCRK